MKKIKLLTMALLPTTTIGATIGMASCSTKIVQPPVVAPPIETTLPLIDNEKELIESIVTILKDYEKLLANQDYIDNKFKDIMNSPSEIEKIKNQLEKNIHEGSKVKWIKVDQVNKHKLQVRSVVSDKTSPSIGFNRVRFQLEVKVTATQYDISYALEGEDFHRGRVIPTISSPIREVILECIYQYVGIKNKGEIIWMNKF